MSAPLNYLTSAGARAKTILPLTWGVLVISVGAVMRKVSFIAKLAGMLCAGLCVAGCNVFGSSQASDAQKRGADLIIANGCGTCHSIPGIAGARGNIGPPLDHIGTRVFIAGMLRNTPDNMMRWLKNPQAIIPGNAMPNMNLNDAQTRDITAYLAGLQ